MKKKVILFSFLIVSLMISASFVIAQLENETLHIDEAYDCIENRVRGRCASLSVNEKIFSSLALEECGEELIPVSVNGECWPNSGCNLKTTAQAVLALNKIGVDTTKAEEWLLSQNKEPTELTWYLEIENTEEISAPYSCTVSYDGSPHEITINLDKKIQGSDLGSCLSFPGGALDNYWLQISQDCYNKEFIVSCDKSFLTTLLFTKASEPSTIHVSKDISTASAGESTTEIVKSLCFTSGSSCDYEGTLWATLILDSLEKGHDLSSYIPYLITMADENPQYLPESFLYFLTTRFKTELLGRQNTDGSWGSGDKLRDTAFTIYSLNQKSNATENAKGWLLDNQDENGCWNNGDIADTGFILYFVPDWYRSFFRECDSSDNCPSGEICVNGNCVLEPLESCGDAGYSCISSDEGCSGNILTNFACSTEGDICCEPSGELGSCEEQEGLICESYEFCTGSETKEASDLSIGEVCCLTGTCESDEDEDFDCEDADYYCRSHLTCIDDGGTVLYDYTCGGDLLKCCDTPTSLGKTCSEEGGETCGINQNCVSGSEVDANDLNYGQVCCVGGSCEDVVEETTECEINGGDCRSSCYDDEEDISYDCDSYSDVCCVEKEVEPEPRSYWWIWLLLLLIILLAVAIVFRDKLRPYWLRIKSKFSKSKAPQSRFGLRRPGFLSSQTPQKPTVQRRILPPQKPTLANKPLPPKKKPGKSSKELDDVLKKLKEMGK